LSRGVGVRLVAGVVLDSFQRLLNGCVLAGEPWLVGPLILNDIF
jgi:hypothetical protein